MADIAAVGGSALSYAEQRELEQHEQVIERGLHTFVEVGEALLVIRDERLYRGGYDTFEDYCKERWGMTGRHANRLIGAVSVVANLGPIGPNLLTNESQVRPLTQLSPEQQREAWQEAIDTAPDGKITAAHIQGVVDRYLNNQGMVLSLPDDTPYEHWYALVKKVEQAQFTDSWREGDLHNFGVDHYGEEASQAYGEIDPERYQAIQNAARTARQNPTEESRSRPLSYEHYEAVSSLPEPVRDEVLNEAEQESETSKETRSKAIERIREIKDGRPVWETIAEASGDEWVELEAADGRVLQAHIGGIIYFMDAAGRKVSIPDLNKHIADCYAAKAAIQRHFGVWPDKK